MENLSVDGIVMGYLPTEKYIEMNQLKPVTNPIYLNGLSPTPDGVLSYEIFGVGEDRKLRLAYIDLGGYHYMNPNAAIKLKQYDSKLYKILMSQERYVLKDKELVLDNENGNTGPEFLYSIWDDIIMKSKSSIITKEIEESFRIIPKEKMFLTKVIVIPAAYRDINTASRSRISTSELNDKYSKIIAYSADMNRDDGFGIFTTLTAARIQTLIIEIYDELLISKLKGKPAKYGHWKRAVLAKNVDNTSRAVDTATNLLVESPDMMLVKFGKTGIPMSQVAALFFPYISRWIRLFFENEFTYGGKYPIRDSKGELFYVNINNTYDEIYIQDMINRFIGSPESRFDPIKIPYKSENGTEYYMYHKGRFHKDNTSLNRRMTWTDLLYLACYDVTQTKHIDITRYPVTSENSQYAGRIAVLSTRDTVPVIIGDKVYLHYPVVDNTINPNNAFIDTIMMSNVYAPELGMDFDGDQTGQKSRWSLEANEEAESQINSISYLLSISGSWMRTFSKEFILTAYMLTKNDGTLVDINEKPPLYKLTKK